MSGLLRTYRAADVAGPLVRRLAGRRFILQARDFPLVLLFSEKAGCTSLTKWFLFHVGKLDEASAFHPWVHRYRKDVLCKQPGYQWQSLGLLAFRRKPIVKLVRNPYDRAVSSFLTTLGTARRGRDSWAGELVAAARAHAGRPVADRPVLSFHDFLRFLAANGTGRDRLDKHVARQYVAGDERRVDRVIKLERFAEEIRALEAEFGLAESPLELITSSPHHRSAVQSTDRGPEDEITSEEVRKELIPGRDSLFTEETRRLVRQAFAEDFTAYGYDA